MNRLICPHCSQPAVSLFQKMKLCTRLPVTCRACGKGLAVTELGWMAYFPAVLLISISGLFHSYAIKFFLWGLAAISIALLMKYWLPLKAQEFVSIPPMVQKGKAIWLFAILLAAIASWNINFFPSSELTVLAMLLAVIATYPFSRLLWLQGLKSGESLIWQGVFFIFFVTINYLAFAVALPAYPTSVFGDEKKYVAEVSSKGRSNKILRCSNSLDLREIGTVCVGAKVWEEVGTGDSVEVVATHLWLGNYIKEVYRPSNGGVQ